MHQEDELEKVHKLDLEDIASSINVAEKLSKKELEEISHVVVADYDVDKRSMEQWISDADNIMELVRLEREPKHTPWQDAANIKYPLISTAIMQFSSRSVAEMSKSGKVAKYRVLGKDKDGIKSRKGWRSSSYINYQLQEKMENWFAERDKLHNQLAACGTAFTKTYYDPVKEQLVSRLIPYDQIIINNGIKDLESATRITQIIYLTPNEIVEHQRCGVFLENYKEHEMQMDEVDTDPVYHELLEQHTWLDLDKDGLKEPYVIVYHIAHKCILRIAPRFEYLKDRTVLFNKKGQVKRIVAEQYFTDYHFIHASDGAFLSLGFGSLLSDTNHTINTILNQLINAGTLSTSQTGIISKDLRIKKEDLTLGPGEWALADTATGEDIRQGMVQIVYKEPSTVLLNLLQLLIDGANNLTSTSEVLTGTTDVTNASPNSVAMLMQQGLKVYSSIQRRIFRGFKKELNKIVFLNARYLDEDEYLRLLDPDDQEKQEMYDEYGQIKDFNISDLDIVPIVDIEDSTQLEAMNKAQAIMQAGLQFAQIGATDPTMLAITYYKALEVENIEALVPAPQPPAEPTPDPALIKAQQDYDIKLRDLQIREKELQLKAMETEARIKQLNAMSVKTLSDADVSAERNDVEKIKAQFQKDSESKRLLIEIAKLRGEKESEQRKQEVEYRKLDVMAAKSSNTSPNRPTKK
jgi:hypothetical protein